MLEPHSFPFRKSTGGGGLTKVYRPRGSDLPTAPSEAFKSFQQSGPWGPNYHLRPAMATALPPSHPGIAFFLLSTLTVFYLGPS